MALLSQFGVTTLVDIRSQPYSQYSPQFSHSNLKRFLEAAGVEYVFAGDVLGGRPSRLDFYDQAGRVLYDKVADTDDFQLGISRLKLLADQTDRLAIMCSEEDPTNCHRRLLVGRVLQDEGVEIQHIRADGRLQAETDLSTASKVSSLVQPGLFDDSEVGAWRSTRSVLPAKPRSNSSSH
jgi:uncharacterized protein (DUF488 family)